MASVTCTCGEACIKFAASRPRDAAECCCCDCTNRLKWLEGEGGPLISNPPQLLMYIDNDIVEIKGEEHLKSFKLRTGSGSVGIFCNKCKTFMINVHFLYFRQRVMIPIASGSKFEYEGQALKPYMRYQTKFYDEEKFGPLPPFDDGPSYASDTPLWPFQSGLLQKFASPRVGERKGQAVQELLKRLKRLGDPIIAGVEEPDLEGHFKTGGGMLSLTFRNPFAKNKSEEEEEKNGSSGENKSKTEESKNDDADKKQGSDEGEVKEHNEPLETT